MISEGLPLGGSVSELYMGKKRDADEFIKLIKPGSRIFIGSGAAEPQALIKVLIEKGKYIQDHETINLIELGTMDGAAERPSRSVEVACVDVKEVMQHRLEPLAHLLEATPALDDDEGRQGDAYLPRAGEAQPCRDQTPLVEESQDPVLEPVVQLDARSWQHQDGHMSPSFL